MGVKEVKLKELLLVFRNGASIKQFEGAEGLPITRIETISDATINPLKVGYANIFDDKYQDYYLQEGDILLSHINSVTHLGKCAIYTNPIDKLIHGMNLLMLRANRDLILPKYLYYVLNSKQFKVQLPKITKKSVNQASMTVTDIGNLKLLIEEDLEQQQKIVEILDKADEIRAKKKLANDKLDEFLKSTFISMFGDPVRNEQKYPKQALCSLCNKITDGTHDTPPRYDSGVMIITGKNIRPFKIDYSQLDYVTEADHKIIYERCNPEYGDVLYTNIGVNLGTAVMNNIHEEFSMKNVALLKNKREVLNSRFLEHILNFNTTKSEIIRISSLGGAQKFLSLQQIRNFEIILPPIEEQNKFAEIVEKVELQKQKNEEVIEQMDNLFNSLSQRAFKGEL